MSVEELHPWLAFDPGQAHRVLTRFIRDQVDRAGLDGAVVGVSGGLDSALTATLSVEALGAEAVDLVFLPGPTTSEEDEEMAHRLAAHLDETLDEVSVGPAFEALEPELGVEADRMVQANLQARLRMTVEYARAQATGRLVMGTGNKSELLTGYFTKHGDGGVDLLPLGDLYKTQTRVLARRLDVPDAIVERPPSAGLWAGQRDEDELGVPYATLDVVLAGIEQQFGDAKIAEAAHVGTAEVQRIREMVASTWHKRNPPPVPKLGWRTVGVDWREPTQR